MVFVFPERKIFFRSNFILILNFMFTNDLEEAILLLIKIKYVNVEFYGFYLNIDQKSYDLNGLYFPL